MACSHCTVVTSGGSKPSRDTAATQSKEAGLPRGAPKGAPEGASKGASRGAPKGTSRGAPKGASSCMADRISLAAALTKPVTKPSRARAFGPLADPLAALSERLQCYTVSDGCPVSDARIPYRHH